jgi:RNA polymerase sigma-70 factor (ECF subfamily)
MTISEYNSCVDNLSDAIFRFLLKNCRDRDLANDLVQDSFLKLWLKRKEVEYAKSKSYLFTTAYHTMIDFFRKDARKDSFDPQMHDFGSSDNSFSDLKEILEEAVQKLSPIQRSVVMLRDYEGYSYKEIGEITDLKEAQVKVYIYRARLFLKNYLVSPEMVY